MYHGAQLGINLVASMLGHLLHHFEWAPSQGVNLKDLDMSKTLGSSCYVRTPLEAIPNPRLLASIYKRIMTTNI